MLAATESAYDIRPFLPVNRKHRPANKVECYTLTKRGRFSTFSMPVNDYRPAGTVSRRSLAVGEKDAD